MLTTFDIVGYITERELNKSYGVSSIWNSLHVELHLTCSFACAYCHAMPHDSGHASYLVVHHAMFMCWLFTMLCASFRCCFFGLVPITSHLWGTVRLRPFVFFMDSFFFLAGFQARWPYPQNHFYLCFASCSLYWYAALPTTCYIMPPILPCQASNPPFLANCWLAMLPLCSAPLIALLVAGEAEVCSMFGTWLCWDITISLIFN